VSTGDPFVRYPNEGTVEMIVLGADTHKVSHTVGAVSEVTGRVLGDVTVKAKRRSFDDLLVWARALGAERVWAIEDCRHVSGALERFLLARGERVVRVAPKLMAGARKSARERGKSDPIDAVAIARAAIREGLETMPVAQLAGRELGGCQIFRVSALGECNSDSGWCEGVNVRSRFRGCGRRSGS
jgi:transposase